VVEAAQACSDNVGRVGYKDPRTGRGARLASTEIFPLRKTSAVTLPCPSGPAARKGQGTAEMD